MKSFAQIYKLITEAFNNFQYKIPSDKSHLLFDFYILISVPIWDIEHKRDGTETKFIVKEAQNEIVNYLKSQFLEELVFCICAEFRHLFDENKSKDVLDFAKKHDMEDFIKKYYLYYNAAKNNEVLYLTDRKIRSKIPGKMYSYNDAYKAYLYTKVPPADFLKFAKDAFIQLRWRSSYGGKPWADICDGWFMLKAAQDYNAKVIAIDHVFDLQHNTDTVFNKIETYADTSDEFSWIKKALDKKRNAHSLYEMWDDMSPHLKHFAAYVIKLGSGTDYEMYLKKIKGDFLVTNKNLYLGAKDHREFMDEIVKVAKGQPNKLEKSNPNSIVDHKLNSKLSTNDIASLKHGIHQLINIIKDTASKKRDFFDQVQHVTTKLQLSYEELLNYANSMSENLLVEAIIANRNDIIDILVELGGLLHTENRTLFVNAVRSRCTHMIDILLKRNAFNINYDDCIGLRIAIELENLSMIKYLVSKGIDVKIDELDNGQSPINYAAEIGNLEIVKYLYDNGAKISENDYSAASKMSIQTFLDKKLGSNRRRKEKTLALPTKNSLVDINVENFKNFIKGLDRNNSSSTVINYLKIRKLSIEDIFNTGTTGFEILIDQIKNFKNINILHYLLINNILEYTSSNDHTAIIFQLINSRNIDNENKKKIIDLLVDHGISINHMSGTWIKAATGFGNIDLIKYLVSKDGIAITVYEQYLIKVAAENNNIPLLKYFIEELKFLIDLNSIDMSKLNSRTKKYLNDIIDDEMGKKA